MIATASRQLTCSPLCRTCRSVRAASGRDGAVYEYGPVEDLRVSDYDAREASRHHLYVDRMAYVSGHGPLKPDKALITGRVGADLSIEQGKAAARQVGLAIIATLKDQGLLGKVQRVVKVLGMVNSTPEFRDYQEFSQRTLR